MIKFNNKEEFEQLCEKYLIYDESIPYYSKRIIKEIKNIESGLMQFSNNKTVVEQLKKDLEEIQSKALEIKPVLVEKYIDFFISVNCLMLEKNKIADPKIISMSYLDFLFYLINNDENTSYYETMFVEMCNLCFDTKNIKYRINEKGKTILIINNEEYNGKDFDNIRNIILYQNIPHYDDTYIDPKVEQALKEAEMFQNKNKAKMASLEDQRIMVLIKSSLSFNEIDKLTIRKFSKILERVDHIMHYNIYKTAQLSGMVEFKGELDHWMSEITRDKYANIATDFGSFKDKINGKTN